MTSREPVRYSSLAKTDAHKPSSRQLCRAVLLTLLLTHVLCVGAEPLPQPTGRVILTVTGSLSNTNVEDEAHFDLRMLESLPQASIRTTTVWTDGVQLFEGVLLSEVLRAVGARGETVLAFALNDYVVPYRITELLQYRVVAAFKLNGKYLRIRDKGPIWVAYPRDEHPELQNAAADHKWIWQLERLHIQ